MTAHVRSKSILWRWVLGVCALAVVGEDIAVRVKPYARQYTGMSAVAAVLSGIALVFLFLGSPFLVRSQGWLAVVGWVIGAATILFSVL